MNPDMPDDIEIGYSSSRMLLLVALAAAMMLVSASIGFDWFGFGGIGRYHAPVSHVGLACFGAATLLWLLSAAKGIRDLCVGNEFILSNSIAEVSSCGFRRRKFLTSALERQLFITKSTRAMLHANRAMGVDGITISISGLTAIFDTLISACTAYHPAAQQAGAAQGQNGGAPSRWIARCAQRAMKQLEDGRPGGSGARFRGL